jgi:mono/diheme cytochrome c family protein
MRSPRPSARALPFLPLVLVLAGCGSHGVQIAKDDPEYAAARTFELRCSGCHTLGVVGTEGSSSNVRDREYKDGPNFNQRREQVEQVLYAIRNGGFSSGPMPQNIVTGKEAEALAQFVAKYSGGQSGGGEGGQGGRRANPGNAPPTGTN